MHAKIAWNISKKKYGEAPSQTRSVIQQTNKEVKKQQLKTEMPTQKQHNLVPQASGSVRFEVFNNTYSNDKILLL